MNPLSLLVLLVSLPLLLGGCIGIKKEIELTAEDHLSKSLTFSANPTTQTQLELNGVKRDEIEYRLDNLYYLKSSGVPYTGKVFEEWSGQQRVETNYIDGKLDGLSESWHENGKKAREGRFKKGKRDGVWTLYDDDGEEKSRVTYENGSLVRE